MLPSGKIILLSLALCLVTACDQSRLNLDIAIVPREVTNFRDVNSSRDDFNSAGPLHFAADAFNLVFSTNRIIDGGGFDFVSYMCYLNYDQVNIAFEIWTDPHDYPVLDTINSMHNEWGPYLTEALPEYYYQDETLPDTGRFFFSSDREGNQDIYCCYYSPGGTLFPNKLPRNVSDLNTEFEEGYLCLHQESTANTETCYFNSNRDGTFDIFKATGEVNSRIENSGSLVITKMDFLSSNADDKCPYIVNNMMVFTSDRTGGQGGFDLWYSIYEDGTWSAPVNFGPGINTEYDEYRPVIIPLEPGLFLNDMLIFSSNRPGGKGGFDLYYTGMNKRTGTSFAM